MYESMQMCPSSSVLQYIKGATVAARRIVTHAVPAYTDVADNPTKVIRQLNDTL